MQCLDEQAARRLEKHACLEPLTNQLSPQRYRNNQPRHCQNKNETHGKRDMFTQENKASQLLNELQKAGKARITKLTNIDEGRQTQWQGKLERARKVFTHTTVQLRTLRDHAP